MKQFLELISVILILDLFLSELGMEKSPGEKN